MNQLELIQRMPKAELHVHIEGTFEPELNVCYSTAQPDCNPV